MQQKRVTGAKECTWTSFGSLSPPKCHIFRQKSAKINFGMSLLHKIIGESPGIREHEIFKFKEINKFSAQTKAEGCLNGMKSIH